MPLPDPDPREQLVGRMFLLRHSDNLPPERVTVIALDRWPDHVITTNCATGEERAVPTDALDDPATAATLADVEGLLIMNMGTTTVTFTCPSPVNWSSSLPLEVVSGVPPATNPIVLPCVADALARDERELRARLGDDALARARGWSVAPLVIPAREIERVNASLRARYARGERREDGGILAYQDSAMRLDRFVPMPDAWTKYFSCRPKRGPAGT